MQQQQQQGGSAGEVVFASRTLRFPGSEKTEYNPRAVGSTGRWLWLPCATLLCDYLSENPHLVRDRTVIELGCGQAMVSMAARLLGAKKVLATDGDPAVLGLARSALLASLTAEETAAVELQQLRWGNDFFASEFTTSPVPIDFILGSDLIYVATAVRPLVSTISQLLTPPRAEPHARCLISFQRRGVPLESLVEALACKGLACTLLRFSDLFGNDTDMETDLTCCYLLEIARQLPPPPPPPLDAG